MVHRHVYTFHHLVGFVITLIVLTGVAFYCLVVFWPQPNPEAPVRIEVSKGSSLAQIAESLKAKKVIDHPKPFVLATRLMGYETSIQAGVFSLMDLRSNFHIIHQLVNGTPVVHRITLHEGLKMAEVAQIFHEKLGTDVEQFIDLCHDGKFIRSLGIDAPSVEGFLFPETYYFREGEDARDIVRAMVEEYQSLVGDIVRQRMEKLGMTELEIVTLASIVEGEAIHDSERPVISAVYHNRLERGMKLQADPTIQYIIDDGPRRLLNRDLRIESPYNTYLNVGLPPGPINNPGKESILAALHPAEVDYLYFVANGDGYHTFSKTEREHEKAKLRFQKHRRKIRREKKRQASSGEAEGDS